MAPTAHRPQTIPFVFFMLFMRKNVLQDSTRPRNTWVLLARCPGN